MNHADWPQRLDVIKQLKAELVAAEWLGEDDKAARLRAEIDYHIGEFNRGSTVVPPF